MLWLRADDPINIEVFDAKSNTTITAILNEVQTFTELPTVAPIGYQVEIVGDPGNAYDNYHVEFEPRSGDFAEGAWIECVSPGVQYIIEETRCRMYWCGSRMVISLALLTGACCLA